MSLQNADHTRTFFLDHDGWIYFYGTGHWLKIECQEVPETPQRPAGIKYSISLFGPDNDCLVRYDNSHAVKVTGRPNPETYDHWHRFGKKEELVPYEFTNCEQLLNDFYEDVEKHVPIE